MFLLHLGHTCNQASSRPDEFTQSQLATDANVILGRINPTYLLGGEMGIHLDTAKEMLAEKIAGPLGMDLMQTAEGIIAVVNANMIRGIRRAGRPGRTYSLASRADALGGQKHPETLSH